ncbi:MULTISPECIES: SLAC1 anion channel family protein [unclassified Pseudomonas]|jgi:tellurite resistance protein|uniref:SLAC1 anion channel family protein n=1 Tax=unclassified Pseudomonas TaxID=196821 RepID=UPI000C83082E|nr:MULTISPECIES: SLAC1 anion channel family protein [unclassified Pseudomonas]MDP9063356.1 SLAC1 anion channel family protein [Pseudomonadota bacterium]AUO25533.1 C4-dicarboxylate ABC transporter [Pseudomonas sp. NC02]MDE1910786.1 SLAC1 anion channel family protein [Pseudomonas sp.]MDE2031633.1 SLAC1 anion channel family protein [Pseudomonas sp.]MDE2188882.1 SLAC1 anion channel family protein [Pseudomonas sp.]|eukprot:gene8613-10108_t
MSICNAPLPPFAVESSERSGSIKNLPINLFGAVMGLAGLSLAWQSASEYVAYAQMIGAVIGGFAILVFIALVAGYLTKWVKYPAAVKAEFNHPISGNFFGTVTIALLLLSAVVGSASTLISQGLWMLGSLLTMILAAIVLSRLLSGNQESQYAVPAWLIPGVAALDIAVTGAHMPMAWAYEFNLFAMAVGSVIALVFFTRIFSRLVHEPVMAKGMTPSLMILIAPFEVGFLAYTNFFGSVDYFASVLFYFGLFLFGVLAFKVFRQAAPFSPAWWAISFPIAALSNAALKYADAKGGVILEAIAYLILAFLTIALAVLTVKTLKILFNGKLLSN